MKKRKKLALLGLAGLAAFTLSGCVQTDAHGKPYGFVYDYLAVPGQHVMDWLAQYVGGYGWSLIVITVVVRLLLLPMMVSQVKKSTVQQEKMALVKPQLTKLQKLMKNAKTQQEQVELNQQMMRLYKDNNISMTGGIGCLPLLIQLPVFAALYAAIRYSPQLSHTVFMGIQLGQKSLLLAILSLIVYGIQGYLSMLGMPKDQRKQMGFMMLISPIMIFFVTMSSPAGLGIYFFIGGLFAILQQLIVNAYRPKIVAQVNAEAKRNPPKVVVPDEIVKAEDQIETEEKAETKESEATNHHPRNQNKQRHHHDD
ncbi:membrane protein insertase YidC [Fructilactobacillus cliffordii]|uniref:Membrane protein insertase YidC n=1 Tax=Fructilactobacillus cliffordii TaxID=2940299 RepID=A0A9Q8ZUA3_9LACO|nr:membrane protein insertase YidC [Fructilactobacillus cliffordii]USS89729.1 membrane protein insertase YidC [Fructilactobacillus cliffordii]